MAFAVPKDRQGVTVRLDRGVTIAGEVFLESVSDFLSIHQKVTAFLENDTAFFPIKISDSGRTEFINKKNVWTVEVGFPEDPQTDYFSHLHMHAITVTAHFRDGSVVNGDLMAEAPREKARLSDCLNMSNNFLCLKTDEKMCYLNKAALRKVVHADKP